MSGRSSGAFFLIAMTMTLLLSPLPGTLGHALGKRSFEASDENTVDYPDYELKKPMPKRAALLLDRLLVALQKAVDNDELGQKTSKSYGRSLQDYSDSSDPPRMQRISDGKTMDLQRRGQARGINNYWRCYFNAVSCFRRK